MTYRGIEIELACQKVRPEDQERLGWSPRAVLSLKHGMTKIFLTEIAPPGVVGTLAEANEFALSHAKRWIDDKGNPKAALENAMFAKLSSSPQSLYDYTIAQYFDPGHPVPAAALLTRAEQQILREACRMNWLRVQAILGLMRPLSRQKVLDAGCGSGALMVRLSREGGHVVGLDIEPERLHWGRALLKRLNASIQVARADCTSMPFGAGSFDKVLSANVFEHLVGDERERAVAEVWRVLKPGGMAFICTDNRTHVWLRSWVRRCLELMRGRNPRLWNPGFSGSPRGHGDLMTADELNRLLVARGFRVKMCYLLPSISVAGRYFSRFICALAKKP